ncbi:hypothetical protein D9M72_449860 [compost metagenome]
MYRPEPAQMKQSGDPFRVTPIRFDRHCFQCALHLSGFHQDDIQPGISQTAMQPLGQRSGFQPYDGDRSLQAVRKVCDRLGITGNLRFFYDLAMLVDHTDRGLRQ